MSQQNVSLDSETLEDRADSDQGEGDGGRSHMDLKNEVGEDQKAAQDAKNTKGTSTACSETTQNDDHDQGSSQK